MWRDTELNVRPLANLQRVRQVLAEVDQLHFQFEDNSWIYVASGAFIYRIVAFVDNLNSAD